MRQLAGVALLLGMWANPTFEQLFREPGPFLRQSNTFTDGVAICTIRASEPAGTMIIVAASRAKDGSADMSKMVSVRAPQDIISAAAIRPGAVFTAQGGVYGREDKYWIDAESLKVTDRIKIGDTSDVDCEKLGSAWKKGGNNLRVLALGAALGAIGTMATREISQHLSP